MEISSTTRASLLSPRDLSVRNVADVGNSHKRQQMVLAHAVKTDVADEDHFVVGLFEDTLQMPPWFLMQSAEKFGVHSGDPAWRIE